MRPRSVRDEADFGIARLADDTHAADAPEGDAATRFGDHYDRDLRAPGSDPAVGLDYVTPPGASTDTTWRKQGDLLVWEGAVPGCAIAEI